MLPSRSYMMLHSKPLRINGETTILTENTHTLYYMPAKWTVYTSMEKTKCIAMSHCKSFENELSSVFRNDSND